MGEPTAPANDNTQKKPADLLQGEPEALKARGISEETCRKWKYHRANYNGRRIHCANYCDERGRPAAQNLRFPDKTFAWRGDRKDITPLYGQWLWKEGGKRIVVTEGELDALSVSQVQGNKWPVVSLPDGAGSAAKSIKAALPYLNTFDLVVLCFDSDPPGEKAVDDVVGLFQPGKVAIAKLPLKDANEMLKAGRGKELHEELWNARPYKPQQIVDGAEITKEYLKECVTPGFDIPYPELNRRLEGLRKGELTLITAGSGIGKSTLAREVAYHLHQAHGQYIGNVYLEEGHGKTAKGYVAIHNDVPLKVLNKNPEAISDEAWDESLKTVVHQKMYFYKHFGSMDSATLLNHLRYMAVSLGVAFVVLDHISIVVSGQESSGEGERKDIDRLLTNLRSLIEETGVSVIGVVHLKQPEGKPHEEGGRVTLSQLRGSGSLKQLADNVIALERNQQNEDNRDEAVARVLKCRETGETGVADTIVYNRETGRFIEVKTNPFDDEEYTDEASY